MASVWSKNPLESEAGDSLYDALESVSPVDVNPAVLSAYVRSHTPSKIPPFEYKGSDIKSSTSQLSLDIFVSRTMFVSSGKVQGRLEIKVPKDGACKIGKISVYLIGMEEILAKGKYKEVTRVFLSKKLSIQDVELVPCDAVFASKPDEHGMYKAKKGKTVLDFEIPIYKQTPEAEHGLHIKTEVVTSGPLPSSYWHKDTGGIRYIVCGVVEHKSGESPKVPLAAYREICMIESVSYCMSREYESLVPHTSPSVIETTEVVKGVFGFGNKGTVKLSASARLPKTDSEEPGVWLSGGIGFIGVDIDNQSSKSINGLTISLSRRIKTFALDQEPQEVDPEVGIDTNLTPVTFSKLIIYEKKYNAKKASRHSGIAIRDLKYAGAGFAEEDYYLSHFNQNGSKGNEIWDGVPSMSKKSLVLDLTIPFFARSIRYGLLFDVSFMVCVTITLKGGQQISIEFPVTILNPLSFVYDVPTCSLNVVPSATYNEIVRRNTSPTAMVENAEASSANDFKVKKEADSSVTLLEEAALANSKRSSTGSRLFKRVNPYAGAGFKSIASRKSISKLPPVISSLSPAARKQSPIMDLEPSIPPPSVSKRTERLTVDNVYLTRSESIDSLDGVPRQDLVKEIDQLFSCVPVD